MTVTKSIGITTYVAIGTLTTFTELCTLSNTDGGKEAPIFEYEPCLADTEIEQGVEIPKDLPIEIQYKRRVGASEVSLALENAVGGTVKLAVKYPHATPVYGRRDCNLSKHENDQSSRPNHLTCSMTLQPYGDWTYSTTAPAT